MQTPPIDVEIDARIIARPPEGWTLDRLWDSLVEAGNDPDRMTRADDHIVVYDSKD